LPTPDTPPVTADAPSHAMQRLQCSLTQLLQAGIKLLLDVRTSQIINYFKWPTDAPNETVI